MSDHPYGKTACLLSALIFAGLLAGCFSQAPDSTGPDNDGTAAATIEMTPQLTFVQRTVTIRAGETVRWRNTSNFAHTVTADAALALNPINVRLPAGAQPFDSGDVQPGADYSRTFTVPGRYDYFCIPHEQGGMVGTIIVDP